MSMGMDHDPELEAIQGILGALTSLDHEARGRVLDYVFRRLGLSAPSGPPSTALVGPSPEGSTDQPSSVLPRPEVRDIRSLKEEKQPRSAVEMAALVAYYLAELAPADERKDAVSTADLDRYFKQARFPLPKALRVTLGTAAASGYLDSVARGQYKLSPVGYNLVVHGLPAGPARKRTRGKSSAKRGASSTKKTAGSKPSRGRQRASTQRS